MTIEDLLLLPPFSLARGEKREVLLGLLNGLHNHHLEHCDPYRNIMAASGLTGRAFESLEQFPFLPVRLFKERALKSIPDDQVLKTLTSSGTTSQVPSRIFIDRPTAALQTRCLSLILQDILGNKRLPMILIDTERVVVDRKVLSARGAGILGFLTFGRDHLYALDDQMNLKETALREFAERHRGEKILIFGFTFVIWQHLVQSLLKVRPQINLEEAILIHGGGWKRLADQAIGPQVFKNTLQEVLGIKRVHNYYGLVEQTGSIFMECENGVLHVSNFSDVLIRDPLDWSVVEPSREGVLEVISLLPRSYPGHCLLTDDVGRILGEDDCRCGRKGKTVEVRRRIERAELRGCSDTIEAS